MTAQRFGLAAEIHSIPIERNPAQAMKQLEEILARPDAMSEMAGDTWRVREALLCFLNNSRNNLNFYVDYLRTGGTEAQP